MKRKMTLKSWANYEHTARGVRFYTKQGTTLFVPNRLIKKVSRPRKTRVRT